MTTTDPREPANPEGQRLLHGDVTETILGAFYATHSQLGFGFLENVYRNAMSVLLRNVGRVVEREVEYELLFHGVFIGRYRADMTVDDKVVVEVKTARSIDSSHRAQLRNYLRASGLQVGLVVNFGEQATFRRIILTKQPKPHLLGRRTTGRGTSKDYTRSQRS